MNLSVSPDQVKGGYHQPVTAIELTANEHSK
jgi:hypothetical protein